MTLQLARCSYQTLCTSVIDRPIVDPAAIRKARGLHPETCNLFPVDEERTCVAPSFPRSSVQFPALRVAHLQLVCYTVSAGLCTLRWRLSCPYIVTVDRGT